MATAQAKALDTTATVEIPNPEFIQKIGTDYRSKIAHVFILHGNINDYSDNSGTPNLVIKTMEANFDDNIKKKYSSVIDKKFKSANSRESIRVFATYNISSGLVFSSEASKESWKGAMIAHYTAPVVDQWRADWHAPVTLDGFFNTMNLWFTASKETLEFNAKAKATQSSAYKQTILFTIVFTDSDAIFPDGSIAQMFPDRAPIVHVRNWARDMTIGDTNRIILITRHLTDIHESIRGGSSGVSTIAIHKPTMTDRQEWLENFNQNFKNRVKQEKQTIMDATEVNLAPGFDFLQFAVQSAGMSRRQMEDVIMKSWTNKCPVDFFLVKERKQRAIEDEYQGIVDFFEPEFGFDHIGGHEHLKNYFERKVIQPLRKGDKRLCTSGMLMTGPPGTGKTQIARAVAKEAKLNFMVGHLDKLFGSLVGETETKTRKFLEAVESAAPCIVFLDELDSILSSGRSSRGDSGTSARMFNAIMQWLSDDSRKGRVVVIAASNRPDLLDAALIRAGRFDALIPALPPAKGDSNGRLQILTALCRKLKIKFSKEVGETEKSKTDGLGRLINDIDRVWTGAEIEVVLKEAFDNAAFSDRKKKDGIEQDFTLHLEDWNKAMDDILPNTEEVERMTKLSLLFVNHLGYCPKAWRDMARNKKALKEELGLTDNNDE